MDEQQIIQQVINGETESFRHLVGKYQNMVFRTCIGFVHQKDDAEDLTQEVFVKVFEALKHFKGEAVFSTWLYRIAINQSLSYLRKKKTKGFISSIENFFSVKNDDYQPSPEAEMITNEKSRAIQMAVDSLPENQRIAFTLSKYDDMKQSEIASIMMISEGAVESLLQRAKKNLQKNLIQFRKK